MQQSLIDDIEHDLTHILESPRYNGNPVDLNRHLHEFLADFADPTIDECSLPMDLVYECFDNAASVSQIIERLNATIARAVDEESAEVQWAKRTLSQLESASPTSLKVTFKLIRQGKNLTFAENFAREYRVAARMMESADFFEGVDAKVISKHNQPKWNPATLDQVSDAAVDAFFAPMEDVDAELPKLVEPSNPRLSKLTDTSKKKQKREAGASAGAGAGGRGAGAGAGGRGAGGRGGGGEKVRGQKPKSSL
jgi:hypothetical protein